MTSSWLHLQRPYFQVSSHSQEPGLGFQHISLGDMVLLTKHHEAGIHTTTFIRPGYGWGTQRNEWRKLQTHKREINKTKIPSTEKEHRKRFFKVHGEIQCQNDSQQINNLNTNVLQYENDFIEVSKTLSWSTLEKKMEVNMSIKNYKDPISSQKSKKSKKLWKRTNEA